MQWAERGVGLAGSEQQVPPLPFGKGRNDKE